MKELIKWSKDLETGIKAFDEEHKILVKTLNEIYFLLADKKIEEAEKLLKNRVVSYADKHFKHEEKVMEHYKYPDLERHKKVHNLFVNILINNHLPKIENGSEKDFRSALNFLVGWLIMHIKNMDKKYGKWFREKNIEINDEPENID